MIRNWSIRNRVLLLALLPMVSLGVVLGGYFIRSRVHDLKASQAALGNTVAHQLASSSLYGMLTHNPQVLQALGQSVIQEQSIDSVAITDNAGQVLAQASTPAPRERGLVASIARQIGAETGFQGSLTFTQLIVWNNTDAATPGQTHGTTIGKVTVRLSEVHFADRQARIIVNGALIMLVCLALSILLALIISSSVVSPIGRVIAVVRRFSGGEHSARVPELSGGELGQLERGINHMAANAQRSQQELQDQVDQATTELRGTLEEFEIKSVELDLARKRALEASRVKTEFLANMSHEIRTPMNAVLGFSDLLTRTPLNDSQRNYLATIRQSAQILLMLLDNILLAARLEMGNSGVHASSIILRELLEDVLQIHAMEAYAKRLELVLDTDGNETQALLADRAQLMRILGNLLANAIKFTPTGSIVIRARSTPQNAGNVQVDIEITDTGIGIREQDQRRLF
ncbi:MAG: HAMP domain-containing protein, partial [Gammaproteobacteria bacterium]|nr:HAMP domain-containing protein [Gammaproteobacteria bacterium]